MKRISFLSLLTALIGLLLCTSCGTNELRIVRKIVTISPQTTNPDGSTFQIEAFGEGITYTSRNEEIARVDSKGLVTGVHAGFTIIDVNSVNGTAEIKVTVAPAITLFDEPFTGFGASIQTVRDSIGSGFIITDSLCTARTAILYNSMYGSKRALCAYYFDIAGTDTTLSYSNVTLSSYYQRDAFLYYIERYWEKQTMPTTDGLISVAYDSKTSPRFAAVYETDSIIGVTSITYYRPQVVR
ncbi:MAG: Ig-like domain-containing protein [Bacteroidaceae bacterium]|nr:Ig-like domain-containing protein [Bacteroidaceae bacterium]